MQLIIIDLFIERNNIFICIDNVHVRGMCFRINRVTGTRQCDPVSIVDYSNFAFAS